jgi:hypothetical protein
MSDTRFPPNSRYYALGTAEYRSTDGRSVVYLRRRLVPDPSRFVTVQEHQVVEGDRIDRMSAAVLGDPLHFHRLLDANGSLHPQELEEVGRRIRLTLPEGFGGASDA